MTETPVLPIVRVAVLAYGRITDVALPAELPLREILPAVKRLVPQSDSDGEDGFRGATLMEDLGVIQRIGTVWSAEATSNRRVEIAYPGLSTWKITAIGRTAHPTEPERGPLTSNLSKTARRPPALRTRAASARQRSGLGMTSKTMWRIAASKLPSGRSRFKPSI